MIQRLQQLPRFERGLLWLNGGPLPTASPEAAHRLRLLLITSTVMGVSSLVVLLIQLLAFIDPLRAWPPITDLRMNAVLIVVCIIVLHWNRHAHFTAAAYLLSLSLLAYTLIQLFQGGDPTENLAGAQTALLTIVLAHLLIGPRAGWTMVGITTLSFIIFELTWHAGYAPTPTHDHTSRALFSIFAWAMTSLLIVLLANSTLDVLRRQTAALEAQVEARTADLRASEQRFRALYEHSPDSVLLMDPQTWTIVECNEAACRINGYSREELIGAPVALLNAPDVEYDPDANLVRLRHGERVRYEMVHIRKDGTRIPIEVTNSLVIIDGRELVLGADRDITQQKQVDHVLRQTLAAELKMNHLRSRVLSMASHDLRTPLAAIQITCDLIQRYGNRYTEEKLTGEHQRVRTIITRMVHMLDDMLALVRTVPSEFETDIERIHLPTICQELIEEYRRAEQYTHTVMLRTEGTPYPLRSYRSPLQHVIGNILGNALKYSPANSTVIVTLGFVSDHVTFAVADQGIGIPTADQAQLFTPFFRARNAQHVEGTGLGLSIVQQSLTLLGGTIAVDSVENEGTAITITLPGASVTAP